MTLVITILASDNAKTRYRARRAAKREQAMQDASLARKIAHSASGSQRVIRATSLGSLRDYQEPEATEQQRNRTWYSKPSREMGVTCTGRQKVKGQSIPAYYD